MGRTYVGEIHGRLSHGTDPTLEQAKSVRSPLSEEEGVAETMCDELIAIPIPHPPVMLIGRW